jgi:F0F1-type ATP synthase assembly protein I
MADPHQDDRRELKRGFKVLAISWVMALAIVLGGFLGLLVDRVTGTFPLLTLLAIGAGVVGGGWYAYKTIMEMFSE